MIVTDLEQFTDKNKSIIYIGAFVELYNWKNRGQVYEIHQIVKFEKIRNSTVKYLHNLGAYCIVKIYSILYNAHIVPKN